MAAVPDSGVDHEHFGCCRTTRSGFRDCNLGVWAGRIPSQRDLQHRGWTSALPAGAAFWVGGVPRYLFVSSAMYAEDYGGVGWSTNTLGGISLSVGYHAWQTSSTYANFQLQDLPPRMTFSAFFARDIRNCPLDPHQTAGFYTAFSTEENIFYNDNATRDWDPNNPNDPHHSYVPQNMDMNNIIVRKTIQVTPTANLASMTVV